jgi:hypothetical protein
MKMFGNNTNNLVITNHIFLLTWWRLDTVRGLISSRGPGSSIPRRSEHRSWHVTSKHLHP